MPVAVDDVETLQRHLEGVLRRADHHATNVRLVVLTLARAIVLFKQPGTHIEVLARHGDLKNALWVYIGGSRYAFSYDHEAAGIVLKRGGNQGAALATFNNSTGPAEILQIFETLAQADGGRHP
ncbi:MAG TPA: hypothetical protein VN924_07820 [Bryobacteraceae bacterium]|nr:hypothetical protein [Bryobacteraceae bacterium]